MRRWLMMLLVASLLVMVVAADEELVNAGPYSVSFDMGMISPYQKDVNESLADTGYLSIFILGEENFAYISGYPAEETLVLSASELQSWLNYSFSEMFTEGLPENAVQYYRRSIDGQEGLLGVLDLQDIQIFVAAYCKNFGEAGSVIVEIGSMYPWDQGTESLLNSIVLEYSPTVSSAEFGEPFFGTTVGTEEAYGTPFDRSMQYNMSKYNASREVSPAYLLTNFTESV